MRTGIALVMIAVVGIAAQAQDTRRERSGERTGEQLGKALDRAGRAVREGLRETRDALRERFAEAKAAVDDLGLEGRVYSRLHWDKDLANADFEVIVEENTVTLRGRVPNTAARAKAVTLARETQGVAKVVDELAVNDAPDRPRPAPKAARP